MCIEVSCSAACALCVGSQPAGRGGGLVPHAGDRQSHGHSEGNRRSAVCGEKVGRSNSSMLISILIVLLHTLCLWWSRGRSSRGETGSDPLARCGRRRNHSRTSSLRARPWQERVPGECNSYTHLPHHSHTDFSTSNEGVREPSRW